MKPLNVHELFSRAAQEFTADIAISTVGGGVTYGELEAKAETLGESLRAKGMPKGSIVGIFSRDTVHVVSSILGILKAGGVFCPLDPDFPDKRLEVMLEEVEPEWFVIDPDLLGKHRRLVGSKEGVRVICADEIEEQTNASSTGGIGNEQASSRDCFKDIRYGRDDMCSIYFTSGSTGRPKAIAGRLKGIDHFIRWEIETLGVGRGMRVSQLTSASFDGFLKDVFVPLCAGGVSCVPGDKEVILNSRRLIRWIDEQRINVLHCVPSVFRLIVNERLQVDLFSALKYVVMAGEPLLPADARKWISVFGERIQLVNLYGPTETTVTKLFYFVKAADANRRNIPIGKPMKGATAVVVDEKGRPCAPGAVGEIYIRTPYRALGYYGRPELTDKAFLANPFNDDPDDIVYRTGDHGRLLEDGNFEFLGRKDNQVKIRGVRVELGEIENALRENEAVIDAVVVDNEDQNGNKYLCAYLVVDGERQLSGIQSHVARYLPEYMVPSTFIEMESLPRTLNGKVDRRALPKPDQALSDVPAGAVAGRTPVEEILLGIWIQVIGLKQIGIHDNFFEIGGHSLLAAQVVGRAREALDLDLPVRSLFEAPTVAGLSATVEAAIKAGSKTETPPIRRVERDGRLPLSFAQERLWFVEQLNPGTPTYNIVLGLSLTGRLSVAGMEQAVSEIIRRNEILRTRFPAKDGRPTQTIAAAGTFGVDIVDLTGVEEAAWEESKRLATEHARRPFNLASEALLRLRMVRTSKQEHGMLCAMHHIISDGWSIELLTAQMSDLYRVFSAGEASKAAEPPVQYADFAYWQRNWLEGEVLESILAYWKRKLDGAPRRLELPVERPPDADRSFKAGKLTFQFSRALTEGARALSRQEGATFFMTLLTAFQVLLHHYTGQDDIVVGSVIANRDRPGTEDLLGLFANILVLRTDMSDHLSFRELMKRVRVTCLEAYAHQDLPLEKLVEVIQPERDSSPHPLFQVWFQLDNVPKETAELPGLTLSTFEISSGRAMFDLSLVLTERPDELAGSIEYDTDLFDVDTIAGMFGHYRAVLEEVVANPDIDISTISMISAAEVGELTRSFTVDLKAS